MFGAFLTAFTKKDYSCMKHLTDVSHQLSNAMFSTVIFTLLSAVGNKIPQVHIWHPSAFSRAYVSLLCSTTNETPCARASWFPTGCVC